MLLTSNLSVKQLLFNPKEAEFEEDSSLTSGGFL